MWSRKSTNPFSRSRQRKSLMSSRRGGRNDPTSSSSLAMKILCVLVSLSILLFMGGTALLGSHQRKKHHGHKQKTKQEEKAASASTLYSSSSHDKEYASLKEQQDRELRFPSVEERVRIYMSNWYAPPCYPEDSIQFNFQLQQDSKSLELDTHKLFIREAPSTTAHQPRLFELQGSVQTDSSTLFYLHPRALSQCRQEACVDVVQNVQPYALGPASRGAAPGIPTLLDLGDKEVSTAYQPKEGVDGMNPTVPRLKKFRLAYTKDEIHALTASHCIAGRRDEALSESTQLGVVYAQPIVWKLKVSRHYGMLRNVTRFDIPYALKKNKALFRGRLSGIHKEGLTADNNNLLNSDDRQKCLQIPRCRLVLHNARSRLVDARLVGPTKGLPRTLPQFNSTAGGEELFSDERQSLQEMLKYKAIVMMEGNDVASGLKWALYSNSIVLMEPVTVSSWCMEERLQPWVHYVPIKADGTNVESQFQWVLDNPIAAERIARNGALWIKDLLFHPQAAADEQAIYQAMMKRYKAHFRANPRLF